MRNKHCCGVRNYRYALGYPIETKNFIEYPTCADVNTLAQYGLVDIIFTEILSTSELQASILDCRTNTLLYKEDGEPLLACELIANKPTTICFDPSVGGYIVFGYVSATKDGRDRISLEQKVAPKKEGEKK